AAAAGKDVDVTTTATTAPSSVTVINSLRLSTTTGGVVTAPVLTLSSPLTVATGGVLLAGNASANSAIVGGTITSGTGELVFNNYSAANGTARELLIASQVTGTVNVVINNAGPG